MSVVCLFVSVHVCATEVVSFIIICTLAFSNKLIISFSLFSSLH